VIVDVRDVEGDVLWQVQDAGEGMVEGSLAKLGKLPETAGPGSARLGIARAWAVVEAHGGLLRFESAPGVGTTATIWLPRVRERWEDTPAEGL
jgi:signal transduction histidine kinase